MPTILATNIPVEGGPPLFVHLIADAIQLSADEGRIDLKFSVMLEGQPICSSSYEVRAVNPLVLSAILVSAAGAYGWCIGERYVEATFDVLSKTYDEVVAQEPRAKTRWERLYHVVNRLPGKGKEFIAPLGGIATKCITAAIAGPLKKS
jgi:hypothetical protein